MQVYVRSLTGAGGARVQVSVNGGTCPLWSANGRKLYYVNNQQVWAASVTTSPTFAVRSQKKLFESDFTELPGHANYDVSPDGKHFLMVRPSISGDQVVVVHNWRTELRERLRTSGAMR
jgi:Tol biopolymer transport system component